MKKLGLRLMTVILVALSLSTRVVLASSAIPVNAPLMISSLVAETSLAQDMDSDGVVVVRIKLDRIKNRSDNSTVNIPGGIGSYTAMVNGLAYSAVSTPGRSMLGGFNMDFMVVAADGKSMFFYTNPTSTTTLVTAMKNTGGNFTTISAGDNITEIKVATNALGTLNKSVVHLDGETIRLTSKDATNLIYTVVKKYTFRSDIDFDTDNKTQNAHVLGKAIKETDWYTPGNVFSEPHDQGVAVASFGSVLYRSTNSGSSWSSRGIGRGLAGVGLVGLAISSRYATDKAVVAASATNVFYSTDGGATFTSVAPDSLATKLEGGTITSVDIGPYWRDGKLNILIGITGGGAVYSNVLRFDLTQFGSWTGIGMMGDNVLKVAYSPAHLSDTEILAVTTNGLMTHLNTHFGQDTDAWNARFSAVAGDLYPVELNANISATPVTSFSASRAVIAFGSDFSGLTTSSLLVGTQDAGATGGVIRVANLGDTTRKTLNRLPGNVSSIAISGPIATGNVLVGMSGSRTVPRTSAVTASTVTWVDSSKHPTGVGGVSVVLWVGGNAVAGTTGNDAAYNVSYDGGVSFNQLGAINVRSASGMTLVDVAIIDANNMFVIMNNSAGGYTARSLFRTTDGGRNWVRVLTGATLEKVVASANYTSDKTLYVTDGTSIVRKSVDSGNSSFTSEWLPANVSAITLVSKDDYFVGTTGGLYRKGSYTSATGLSGTVKSIALSPAFATDGTILVGNDAGSVFISTDTGVTFSGLGSGGSLGAGTVYVAPDPKFATNKTIYAASSDPTKGIRRTDSRVGIWLPLDTDNNTLVAGGLALSPGGSLYVASNAYDRGIRYSSNPTVETPTFQSMTGELPWGARLTDPELSAGRVLYVIATGQSEAALTIGGSGGIFGSEFGYHDRLVTITDNLSSSGIKILAVRGVPPFDTPTIDYSSGIFSATAISSPPQANNTTVAKIVPILTGNTTTSFNLTVAFQTIGAALDPALNVPEERPNTITLLRGDVDGNDALSIADSLALKQYLVGQLALTQINALNAASPSHDGAEGDKITVADALAIEQYLVKQLNAYFE